MIELIANIGFVVFFIFCIEGLFWISNSEHKESHTSSMRALLGKSEIHSWNAVVDVVYGEKLSLEAGFNEWPKVPLSFSTFLALWEADPNKFTICLTNIDDELPGAILYDQNKDRKANARVIMRTRKDAKAFIKWFKSRRQEEFLRLRNQESAKQYENIVSATEAMQADLEKLHKRHHQDIIHKVDTNKKWRQDAEKRHEQNSVCAGGGAL